MERERRRYTRVDVDWPAVVQHAYGGMGVRFTRLSSTVRQYIQGLVVAQKKEDQAGQSMVEKIR